MQKQLSQTLYLIGGSLAVFGAIAQLLEKTFAPYFFSAGAIIFIGLQVYYVIEAKSKSNREQRLARMGLFSTLLLGLSAYFMFIHSNSWVVALLIYALTTLFFSFRTEK